MGGRLAGLLGLLFSRAGGFAETGKHLVDFLLVGGGFVLDDLDDFPQVVFPLALALLLDDQVGEVALVDQVEVRLGLEAIPLVLLLDLLEGVLDLALLLECFVLDLFIQVLQLRLLESELCLQIWLNKGLYTRSYRKSSRMF